MGGFGVSQAPSASNLYRNVPSMAQTDLPPAQVGGYPGTYPGAYPGVSLPHYVGGFGGYTPHHQFGMPPGQEAMQGAGRFYLPPAAGPPGGYPPGMYLPPESQMYHGGARRCRRATPLEGSGQPRSSLKGCSR